MVELLGYTRRYLQNSGDRSDYVKRCSHETQLGSWAVPVIEELSLADSLGGGIGLDNQYSFQLVRDLVDQTLLVSKDEIVQAMCYIFETQRLVVQGGAAIGVATLMAKKIEVKGKNVALVYSGNDVSLETVRKVLEGYNGEL